MVWRASHTFADLVTGICSRCASVSMSQPKMVFFFYQAESPFHNSFREMGYFRFVPADL